MTVLDNTPNIVVDENFLMLEKRLRRKYAAKANICSNADAIEQEKNAVREYAVACEAYGDSKFIGGASSFETGGSGTAKYMTTDDYVAYFERCRDTFGAMSIDRAAHTSAKNEDGAKILVNRKKIEQIKKLNAPVVKKTKVVKERPQNAGVKDQAPATAQIESSKLDAFFTKLSKIKGRAVASVAAFAICCTVAVGGIVSQSNGEAEAGQTPSMARLNAVEQVEENNEGYTSLLSVLE